MGKTSLQRALVGREGTPVGLHGASTEAGSRARANHLVKWEAMRSSRERGYARYDMWGTERDMPGLSEFKAGFGGTKPGIAL